MGKNFLITRNREKSDSAIPLEVCAERRWTNPGRCHTGRGYYFASIVHPSLTFPYFHHEVTPQLADELRECLLGLPCVPEVGVPGVGVPEVGVPEVGVCGTAGWHAVFDGMRQRGAGQ